MTVDAGEIFSLVQAHFLTRHRYFVFPSNPLRRLDQGRENSHSYRQRPTRLAEMGGSRLNVAMSIVTRSPTWRPGLATRKQDGRRRRYFQAAAFFDGLA